MSVDLEDYSLARVIKGIYDSTYTTIAVDADGNIVGVFKGDYNGTLKTLKTDSSGRLLAIITDPEDVYGNIHMVGNAELAARLGSINTFDRRGDTVWMDDFEGSVLKWVVDGTGSGYTGVLDASRVLTGSQCCKLTTGALTGNSVEIIRLLAYPVIKKMGFEIAFTQPANLDQLGIGIDVYDGAKAHNAMVRYETTGTILAYRNSGNTYTELADISALAQHDYLFHQMKLVIDLENGNYDRFILNETEHSMSSISYYNPSDTVNRPHMSIKFWIKTITDAAISGYADNAIVTQNEP